MLTQRSKCISNCPSVDTIKIGRKGKHLNTSEKCHIYKISRNNLHMNVTHIEMHNPIFQTVHEIYDRQQHTRYLEKYISKSKYDKNQYTKDNERKGTRKKHKCTPT
jgi:hypothetical protein